MDAPHEPFPPGTPTEPDDDGPSEPDTPAPAPAPEPAPTPEPGQPVEGRPEDRSRAGTLGALALMRLEHIVDDLRAIARTTVGGLADNLDELAGLVSRQVDVARVQREKDRLPDDARPSAPASHPTMRG